jgi:hypothetical protein
MKLRDVRFADEAACIADVERLRAGWRAGGAWTLGQACWHLNFPLEHYSHVGAGAEPTAEQRKIQGFIDQVLASGWPEGLAAAKAMLPPADVGLEAVDALVASLRKFQGVREARVSAFVFGPVETERLRQFAMIHSAHHLSFFEPTATE